jgi:hypothetical protein
VAAAGHVPLSYDGFFGRSRPRQSKSRGMLIQIGVGLTVLA